MLWVFEKIRIIFTALATQDSPRQMAAGIACGVVLGFVPKGNLLAMAMAALLLATRMSLATGMPCALLISLVAPRCDPFTHRIGEWILTNRAMLPFWRSVAELPLAAWTAFNNTVVMGSLITGAVLTYPVYCLSLPWMERLQRWRQRQEGTRTDDTAESSATIPMFAVGQRRVPEGDTVEKRGAEQVARPGISDRGEAGGRRSCA